MKKFLSLILTIVILIFSTSCLGVRLEFETDGVITYLYAEGLDSYTVVGLEEKGKQIETLYIPPYFEGKPVERLGYETNDFTGRYFTIPDHNLKKIYYPYTFIVHDYEQETVEYGIDFFTIDYRTDLAEKQFFVCNNSWMEGLRQYFKWYSESSNGVLLNLKLKPISFLTPLLFNKFAEIKWNEEIITVENNIYNIILNKENKYLYTVQIANTSYMFNYDGEPNDGYFFINDFERGGVIENTPYEPTREGYTFAGWYKEPECINAWDFEVDTLPEAEYDENGELIFVETKLYAKWS